MNEVHTEDSMYDIESIDLQGKLINKLVMKNNEKLFKIDINNKLSYHLYINNKTIITEIEKINSVYKIIDASIVARNYKRAFRFYCYLSNLTEKLIKQF